jgi:hypothetical protein
VRLLPWPDGWLAASRWDSMRGVLERCWQAATGGRLAATLMLVGEPGMGREAVAVELAAALICRSGHRPGCTCGSCDRVRRGIHPDLEVLDVEPGHSDIRIGQARALLESADRAPYEGARRVVIVASCQTPPLNWDAASALLKVLEEPQQHLTFLLLAANPLRVLPTVLSRSVQVRLPAPKRSQAVELLAELHGVPPAEAERLLVRANGDVGLLVRAIDPALAGTLELVVPLLDAALDGDGLSIVRLGSLLKNQAVGIPVVVGELLSTAADADPDRVELVLDAAGALLAAEGRRLALRLDVESVLAGTLAAATRRRARPLRGG